jgi:phosphatidylglycerophosphate synthase
MASEDSPPYIPRRTGGTRDVIANLISFSRLLCVPALIVAACLGATRLWLLLLGYAFLSDVVDGRIARRLGTASDKGARIDSMADCALYLTAPLCVLMVFPWIRAAEWAPMLALTLGYAIPVAYGFAKYQRLTSYHTTGARVTAVLLCASFAFLLVTRDAWPFHLAIVGLLIAAMEEIFITRTLSHWQANIPSIREARRRARLPREMRTPAA